MKEASDSPAKVAVITGTSRGLGQVLAGVLAKQGDGVILTARGGVGLTETVRPLRGASPHVVPLVGDVTSAEHRHRLVLAAKGWGRIDLLVNNASELGTSPLPPLAEASRQNLLRVFDVNVLAPLALIQEALPLLERVGGLVVNISSDAALGG